jgi:glycosyltransferase involved in cell wall biosynthesis/phosphorylcholine metabolism protein LicD
MKYNSDILRQLHEELYDVLREVIRVCDTAGIPYFIQGGTAIGAHFFDDIVPWDDDVDLGMTRDNYERFLREAPALLGEGYVLQEFTTERETPFYFAKVRKRGTRFVEREWVGMPIEEGIYIDIFPYDLVPDDEALRRKQRAKVGFWVNCFMAKSVWLWRWFRRANNGVVLPKSLLSCLAIRLVTAIYSKEQIYAKLKRELTRYNNSDAKYYNIVRMPKDMIAVAAINTPERRKMGAIEVTAPSDLETYLRSHYGDIQKWLPEDKRLNHAPEILSFGHRVQTAESERISVVMPLYNKEAEVERALRSVIEQSLAPREVIVVDDGSTDGSRAIVERIIAEHPEAGIRLISQPNGGVSSARNRGIAEATGDYIALLDADDMWLTGYIAEVCRLMEYYPEADAYSTAFDIVSGTKRVAASTPTTEGYINIAEEALQRRYPIIPSTATLRREAVLRAGGFPKGMRIGEDQWLWTKMLLNGAKFCFSPMSLVRYWRTASNRSASIYRAEQSTHTLEELYTPNGDAVVNEYIARIAIGKAITQSVRGGTDDARHAAETFAYTTRSRRQLRRLRLLNALPKALRPMADGLYSLLAWTISRKGL